MPDNMVAQNAINQTFYHWGLHPWVTYGVMGIVLAFMTFRFVFVRELIRPHKIETIRLERNDDVKRIRQFFEQSTESYKSVIRFIF